MGVTGTKRIGEGSGIEASVGIILGRKRVTDDETARSVSLRGNVWNIFLKSGGGRFFGGGLGTSVVCVIGI